MWDWPEATPTPEPTRWPELAGIALAMAAGELLAGLGWWTLRGSLGLLPLLGGMVLGAALALRWRAKRSPQWLSRARLKTLAGGAALAHLALGGLAWATLGAPPELGLGGLVLGSVAVGLLVGGAALVVVLCVGDVVAMIYAPFPEKVREQRWRRR